MFGTCKDCGVDNLALYPNEEESTLFAIVCWKCFRMEKVVIKKGEEKIK
jgi:L-rhamnose mutarotase